MPPEFIIFTGRTIPWWIILLLIKVYIFRHHFFFFFFIATTWEKVLFKCTSWRLVLAEWTAPSLVIQGRLQDQSLLSCVTCDSAEVLTGATQVGRLQVATRSTARPFSIKTKYRKGSEDAKFPRGAHANTQ